jgi:feruloyl esterase
MLIPYRNTVDYYERLRERYKGELDKFVKFYLVTGMAHGDGPFAMKWDAVSILDRWVEQEQAPSIPIGIDSTPGHNKRTRPLCEYPSWPKYRGQGNPDDAASFVCSRE